MIRNRLAGARALLAGLAVAAVVAGSAAAATPSGFWFRVHARLAPATGATTAAGSFSGVLAKSYGGQQPVAAVPRTGSHWQLTWGVSAPRLSGSATVSLRIRADNGAAAAVRVLCTSCTAGAKGSVVLTSTQASRVIVGDGVVVVRTRSATLRGTVKAVAYTPVPPTK